MSNVRVIHLASDDVSLILASFERGLPIILHWGSRIEATDDDLLALARAEQRPGLGSDSDLPYRPSMLPEHGRGWFGRPGLSAHRAGRDWVPSITVAAIERDGVGVTEAVTQAGPGTLSVTAHDAQAQIALVLEIDLTAAGLLRTRAGVRNDGDEDEPLVVQDLAVAIAVPTRATEILDFCGRWGHERLPQRHPVMHGTHARASRRGRTGLDATTVMLVGSPGFTASSGEVWMFHVGFSGGHEHAVERGDGALAFRGGELLLPGEIRLARDEEYLGPWVYGSYGEGWDSASARFHAFLRGISRSARRDRPVTLNVWEAVYFDHDAEALVELAEHGAALGVERFVLDDGWFRGRADDRTSLGDWSPDPVAWPEGLRPLADRVRELGMEFGLWVEPEMVSEDSDLARAHPEWILRARDELPARYRFQQVLDLTAPEPFAYILETLDALIREIGVSYLKWDHNRDLVAAGHPATGTPAVHAQTLALYRMLDELRARHPELEIESCASGGGRVDLGILERADRIHPSDSHDPVDRFDILRHTGMLVPPEMMGSHVASAVSSVTGRTSDLHFRCAVAFLGHFGIEWDVRELSDAERSELATWTGRYRRHRRLIQRGRAVSSGAADASAPRMRGVVADDKSEALFTIVTPRASMDALARVRLSGLDPRRHYRVTASTPPDLAPPWQVPDWLRTADLDEDGPAPIISGSLLTRVGLELPTFHPDRAVVVHLRSNERS